MPNDQMTDRAKERELLEAVWAELEQTRLLVAQLSALVTGEPVRVPLRLHL